MTSPAESMLDLTGRVAIVTGGGTGIGAATAHLLAPALAEPSPDPRQRFTHIELGPATTQATVLRDLVLGATPACDVAPATFADGVACMEVLDAMRRSAANGGQLVEVAS